MSSRLKSKLEVWVAARDRFTDAAESLAVLNVHSKYRRPDDAPEVLAYHAAEQNLARAGDELYAVGRGK